MKINDYLYVSDKKNSKFSVQNKQQMVTKKLYVNCSRNGMLRF